MTLTEELKMQRPFVAAVEEAVVSIIATKARVEEALVGMLARHGITRPQFNILRILRGASPESLTCSTINERLVEKNPDVTRLLDRLEKAGLIERFRGKEDRRNVHSVITPGGLRLLGRISKEMLALEHDIMAQLTPAEVKTLLLMLQKIRDQIRTLQ